MKGFTQFLTLVLVAVALTACTEGNALSPLGRYDGAVLEITNPRQLVPDSFPATFATDWADAVHCTGRDADLGRITFWRVAALTCANGDVHSCASPETHDIWFASGYERSDSAVTHQMIHDLLLSSGHDRPFEEAAFRACGV